MNKFVSKLLPLFLLLFAAVPAFGQSKFGAITAASTDCSVANSCVSLLLNQAAGGATITLTGTWSATLNFEVSGDNGVTWAAASTASSTTIGVTNISVAGYTNLRVRCNPFTSGTVNVTIYSGTGSIRSGSSSSGAVAAGPAMGFYLAGPNACSVSNIGFCYNTFADTQQFNDCGWTAATPSTVTCATSHFVAADVGKQVAGWNNCEAFATSVRMGVNAITASGAPLITSFISGTQVQITTAANAQTGTASCFIYGHPDDANVAILEAAYGAVSAYCPKVFLAAANYMFTKPHFFTTPPGCAVEPMSEANVNPGFGNVFYSGGFELEGRGVGATEVFLMPNFPNGDPCGRGADSKSCFAFPTMSTIRDISFTGGSLANAATQLPVAGSHTLMYANVSTLERVTCTNFGGYTTGDPSGPVGLLADFQVQLYQYNNSGCGAWGIQTISGHGGILGIRVAIENSLFVGISVTSGTSFSCESCNIIGNESSQSVGQAFDILNQGGTVTLSKSILNTGGGATNQGIVGYKASVAGSVLNARDSLFIFNTGQTINGSILCTATCTNRLENVSLSSQAGAFDIQDVAGSKEIDLGGNTVTPRMSISGTVVNSPSIAITPAVAGNFVPSANWGTSAAVTAVTGNATNFTFTLTNGSAAVGANPTIVFTFPTPSFWQTPARCSLWQVGGTQAITATTTTLAPSAQSATVVTFTYNGTPTINLTEFYQGSCTN